MVKNLTAQRAMKQTSQLSLIFKICVTFLERIDHICVQSVQN